MTARESSAVDLDSERVVSFVPEDERHGTSLQQFRFWFLSNFQFYAISIGFIGPAMGLSFWWSVVAGVAGMTVGTTFMALHGTQGPHLGLPQMIQSRGQFGHRGVIIPIIAATFVYVASSIISFVIIGGGLDSIYGIGTLGVAWLTVVLSCVAAAAGYDWLHKLYSALLYVSLPIIVVITIALPFHHSNQVHPGHFGWTLVGFVFQFTASASYNITLAPYVSDYTRYMPSNVSSAKMIAALGLGAAGSGVWMIAIGSWLATRLDVNDALTGLRDAGNDVFTGFGDIAAILSVLTLVLTMAQNSYSSMLSLVTIRSSFGRVTFSNRARVLTIVAVSGCVGLIGSIITGSAVTALGAALTLNLAFLVPWTAINLVDYFILRRGHFIVEDLLRPSERYGMWSTRGLLSYAIGMVSMAPFIVVADLYTGPWAGMFHGADVSWVLGLVISAISYVALTALGVGREADHAQTEAPSVADAIQTS